LSVVVGVDVGSRSVRAVALDRDGTVVCHVGAPYAGADSWPTGVAEPERWLDAVGLALERLVALDNDAASPAALAVGGQSPTAIPLEGKQALTYQFSVGVEGGLHAQQREQCNHLRASQPDVEVFQLWDWVLFRMGAPRRQGRWPGDRAIDELGKRVDTGNVVGEADGTFAVAPGTPLVAGGPDALLTFWAAGLDETARACDPGGRSGGLVVAAEDRELPLGLMRMASPAKGCIIVGGPVSAHGAALDWLSAITGRHIEELLSLAALAPPGARGVMFLPYLDGERAPRWQPALTGAFHGLRSETQVADLARAVLEGTAYGLAHIQRLLLSTGIDVRVVTCTGSPSRSALWCEIKASLLGVPLEVPSFRELSAYGAALAAGAGAGWWPAPACADAGSWPRPSMTRVEPRPEAAYAEGLERFLALGDFAEQQLVRPR